MSVRFRDSDPRPVSPGFARQRAERQRAADEAGRADRLEDLGRGLASLIPSPRRPAPPAGYVQAVADANRRAADAYPVDGLLDPGNRDAQLARRNAYVAGYLAAWLSARA